MTSFLWLLLYLAPLLGLTAALFGWFGWQWRGSDLQKRIQDLNVQLDDAQKARHKAETEHAAALGRATSTPAAEPPQQQEQNTAELQSLRDDLKAAQNEIRVQQDAAAKAREAAMALETENARLLSDLEHLRAAQTGNQQELAAAKAELTAARAEHAAVQRALAAAEAELAQLRSSPPATAPAPETATEAPPKPRRKRSTTAKPKASASKPTAAPAATLGEKIAALESRLAAQQNHLATLTQERDDWRRRIHEQEENPPPDASSPDLAGRSLADSEKRLAAAAAEVERLKTQARALRRIEENAAASSSVPGDDLTQIKGIKKVISEQLYAHGIRTWRQIALWDEEELRAFCELLAFKNRATREHWQDQARTLHEAAHGPLL